MHRRGILLMSLLLVACSGASLGHVLSVVDDNLGNVERFLNLAQSIWNQIAPLLPADTRAKLQTTFLDKLRNIRISSRALQQVSDDAKKNVASEEDLKAAAEALTQNVRDLQDFLHSLRGVGLQQPVTGFEELDKEVSLFNRK